MINTKKIGSVLKNINNIDELSISDLIDCNQGQLIAVKVTVSYTHLTLPTIYSV